MVTVIAAIAAIAAASAALTLNNMQQNQKAFNEKMIALNAISNLTKGFTAAGGHCTKMLSKFSKEEFKIFFSNEQKNKKKKMLNQKQVNDASRCFVGYKGNKMNFESGRDLFLNNDEYSFLAHEVSDQLNNYEVLSLHWSELGDYPKEIICKQAIIAPKSPYRLFMKVAKGTVWWGYPLFEEFMDKCQ